jgi:hypothetical protein
MVSQLKTATIGGRESCLYNQRHELQTRASKVKTRAGKG